MQSDPKQCLYCTNNQTLHNLMIEICELSVSRAFLFKEQTYRGRCLVAYKDHVNDLNELSDDDRNAFMADVARVTRAMQKAFNPEKINYGAYSDKLSHLHFHLAPKYVDGPDYGGTFQMNPGKVYLSDAEYAEMIEKINYGAYSDKLSHLHFHLAPKYVDGPDYGGTFQMNPGKVYLSDAEYQELIDQIKANL